MNTNHYRNKYETVDIAEDWKLSGPLFNVLKYIQRRGRKDSTSSTNDLLKAIWYLVYEVTKSKEICDGVIEIIENTQKSKAVFTFTPTKCSCPECQINRLKMQKQL
jgi:hypothetical protein